MLLQSYPALLVVMFFCFTILVNNISVAKPGLEVKNLTVDYKVNPMKKPCSPHS